MLLALAPYVFGTLLLLIILASFWAGSLIARLVVRRPEFRVFGWILSILFFAPLLSSAVVILRNYHDFAFNQHLNTLIDEARRIKQEDIARSHAPFAPIWQAKYENASLESWIQYGQITTDVLNVLRSQQSWRDCSDLLRDSAHLPYVRAGAINLATQRILTIHALGASSRRNEKDFDPIKPERAFSHIALRILDQRSSNLHALESYVFLLFGITDKKGITQRADACKWGIEMYRGADKAPPKIAASFLSAPIGLTTPETSN
ncbi:MAG: hypothetical protein OD811_03775 [Alphaproteobacteria bacterium]